METMTDAELYSPTDMDLLLIGKTGQGKSATGNSILQRKAFVSKCSMSSVTTDVQYEVSEFSGRVIKVVDGPGVGDNRLDSAEALGLVRESMEYAIACNPRGYHAILLVVRLGGRFTAEDLETIAFLKCIFGPDFARKFCIVVLTCGDNFDADEMTIEEWCAEQTGGFKSLLTECANRVVLFDNVTKDKIKMNSQLKKLINMVDNLCLQGHRYSDENFIRAQKAHDYFMVEAKKTVINEDTMAETSLIIQKLQAIQQIEDPESQIGPLEILLTRTENLYDNIEVQDKGTKALENLLETVRSLRRTINEELDFCSRMVDEKERMMIHEEDIRRQLEEELKKMREDYTLRLTQLTLDEEIHRQEQKEEEELWRAAENRRRAEREKWEREIRKELEEECRKQKKKAAELEKLYQVAKRENDTGFFLKIVEFVSWSLIGLAEWLKLKPKY